MKNNRPYKPGYFDKRPEMPPQVFGYETDDARRVLRVLGRSAIYSKKIKYDTPTYKAGWQAYFHTNDTLRTAPLAEKALSGQPIELGDIRANRKALKKIAKRHSAALRWADRGCKVLSFVGVGIPLRKKLNGKLDQAIVDHIPGALEKLRAEMPAIDEKMEQYLQIFETIPGSPKEMVVGDISNIVNQIQYDARANTGGRRAISLGDVGKALRQVGNDVHSNPDQLQSYVWASKNLGYTLPPMPIDIPNVAFELIAPTLLSELGSWLPDDHEHKGFCGRVGLMRHPLEGLADFKQSFTDAKVHIRQASGAAELIPSSITRPREIYADLTSRVQA